LYHIPQEPQWISETSGLSNNPLGKACIQPHGKQATRQLSQQSSTDKYRVGMPDELSNLFITICIPEHILSDCGSESNAKAAAKWPGDLEVKTCYREPRRNELLDRELLTTLLEAKVLIENWRQQYNQERPRSSFGYRPPALKAISGRY